MSFNQDWMRAELEQRDEHATRRKLYRFGASQINLSSNDYLGLRCDSRLAKSAASVLSEKGLGSGASRLVTGNSIEHELLESELGEYFAATARLFSSGYLANIGLLPAIADRGSVIFLDKLAHASLIDGAMLSRAKLMRFKHNDVAHLRKLLSQCDDSLRKIIVTESIFSMDGDIAPLADLVDCAEEFSAGLVVDEAHAFGAFGDGGRGVAQGAGVADFLLARTGTFSKAFGSFGGFVLGSELLCEYLLNTARSFIYDTSLPLSLVEATRSSLEIISNSPEVIEDLQRKASFFRDALQQNGAQLADSSTHIVPVLIGDSQLALSAAEELRERGILAVAIREPTVPRGSARLRFSVSVSHSDQQLGEVAHVVGQIITKLGVAKEK